jgi:biopolymer transport protein ExbB
MSLLEDFMSIMDQGGPIMWVIFIAASTAMVLLIWQGMNLMKLSKLSMYDQTQLMNHNGHIPNVHAGKKASPLSQLLQLLNWSEISTKQDLAREMNVHVTDIALKVEGSLPTIATIGTLLPMLGLLGTVTGMINVFEVIAVQGSGKPDEMAHGISEAMLTTASGLVIAIPVIFMHHMLTRRQTLIMKNLVQSMQIMLHIDIAKIKHIINKNVEPSLVLENNHSVPTSSPVNVSD